MPWYVHKIRKGKTVLLSEHLHLEDAKLKAARLKGTVVTDEHGTVVTE